MHFAADRHYIVKMSYLLEFGADIDALGSDDSTPLHKVLMSSVDENRLEAVKLLLEKGANTRILNYKDKTAIEIAQEKGYAEIVQIFEQNSIKIIGIPSDSRLRTQ